MNFQLGIQLPSKEFRLFYMGYLISCISDRIWMFASIFILSYFGGMLLVAVNQFIGNIIAMLLISHIGKWLDRCDRKRGVLLTLAFNNLAISLAATLLAICFVISEEYKNVRLAMLVMSLFGKALSRCASQGEKMVLSKDWLVVLTNREDRNKLSEKNCTMSIIDQITLIICPVMAAYLLKKIDYFYACFIMLAWNLLSWVVERYLLIKLYTSVKELSRREHTDKADKLIENEDGSSTESGKSSQDSSINCSKVKKCGVIKTFLKQKTLLIAMSIVFLHMTVLSFDGVSMSYAKAQGLPEDLIGNLRSIASVMAMSAAFIYRYLARIIGARYTGLIGLSLQLSFVLTCTVSIFLPGTPFDAAGYFSELSAESWSTNFLYSLRGSKTNSTLPNERPEIHWSSLKIDENSMISILVFLVGITMTRLGVWLTSLCITHQMQETVPANERGTVFGFHSSLCSFFSVTKNVMVIMLPDPRTFGILILISCCFTSMSYLCYVFYVLKDCLMPKDDRSENSKDDTIEENELVEEKNIE